LKLRGATIIGRIEFTPKQNCRPAILFRSEGKKFCLDVNSPHAIGRARRLILRLTKYLSGAAREIRTPDPIITNDVLYQLSYCGPIEMHAPAARLERRCSIGQFRPSWQYPRGAAGNGARLGRRRDVA
jgi:hypothetical protein